MHRTPLKEAGNKNGKAAGNRTGSKGKNNGSAYDGGRDEEGNLGACDVFVDPDGEVTQASLSAIDVMSRYNQGLLTSQ